MVFSFSLENYFVINMNKFSSQLFLKINTFFLESWSNLDLQAVVTCKTGHEGVWNWLLLSNKFIVKIYFSHECTEYKSD